MITVIVRSGNSQDTRDRDFIVWGTAEDYLRALQTEGHCAWADEYPAKRFLVNGEEVEPAEVILRDGVTLEVLLR